MIKIRIYSFLLKKCNTKKNICNGQLAKIFNAQGIVAICSYGYMSISFFFCPGGDLNPGQFEHCGTSDQCVIHWATRDTAHLPPLNLSLLNILGADYSWVTTDNLIEVSVAPASISSLDVPIKIAMVQQQIHFIIVPQ